MKKTQLHKYVVLNLIKDIKVDLDIFGESVPMFIQKEINDFSRIDIAIARLLTYCTMRS